MSMVLDYLEELKAGNRVWGACPECVENNYWWIPGNPALIEEGGDWDDDAGLRCGYKACNHELSLGPPTILCAVCGEPLRQSTSVNRTFLCQGCGRRVTA